MSSMLDKFAPPVDVRSPLLRARPDTVPSIDELDALHAELVHIRKKTLDRAKKADHDLRAIDDFVRRAKERLKGKARAVEKVPEPSAKPLQDPRRPYVPPDLKQKKKKRKREDDSDIEESGKAAKTVPTVHVPSVAPQKLKLAGSASSHGKPLHLPDFSVPPQTLLVPDRPAASLPPVPGPSQPTDVSEDFSKLKQPSQTPVNTFYTSIEPWIRGIKEEDVGFLEFTADELEPYVMPKLGRHYLDVWEENDTEMYGTPLPGLAPHRTGDGFPLPKWDPSTLAEPDLTAEERSHGPLTERLISALLPIQDAASSWKGVKAAEDAMEGRPGGTGAAAARREKVNVADLEDRIHDTMRFHGLLAEPLDYSGRVDDPIATALRDAQSRLRTVVASNKARKARLASIAKDRLGYQEYLELRDTLDKSIIALYGKLQKKDAPKLTKKKKKSPEMNGNGNGNSNGTVSVDVPKPPPSALGLGPDDDLYLVVPDQLKQLVETRRQWVATVGGVFDDKERACPGRIWGLPNKSVYDEPEGDARTMSRGDEMDVG